VQTATFIAGISGTAVVGDTVVVNADGKLGTATSSARFKKEIKPMDKASEAILALKPVSFQYKSDTTGTPRFGLIAEEVAEVNPDLVVRDRKGEIYSVRYDAVNAMLLNEFLKEHRRVEKQEATISQLRSTVAQQQKDFEETVAQLTARLDEQASEIQNVSAQLATANREAPKVVSNGQ
jgi:septal ring factor EnvC (AmiA/AmiB activator)